MEELKNLGKESQYRFEYNPSVLEIFENKHPEHDYWVKFNCPARPGLFPVRK